MSRYRGLLVLVIVILLVLINVVGPLKVEPVRAELTPGPVCTVGHLAISNKLLASWLSMGLLVGASVLLARRLRVHPADTSVQSLVEALYEGLLAFVQRFLGSRGYRLSAHLESLLLYIATMNGVLVLPILGALVVRTRAGGGGAPIPLMRGGIFDLNTMLALALFPLCAAIVYAAGSLVIRGYCGRQRLAKAARDLVLRAASGARDRVERLAAPQPTSADSGGSGDDTPRSPIQGLLIVLVIALLIVANFVSPLKMTQVRIELKPEWLTRPGFLGISNTLVGSWLAMILLIGMAALVRRRIVDRPAPLSLQNIIEALFEALLNFMHRFVGDKNWTFFPVVGTFFLYILLMNWCSILPGFGSIGIYRLVDGERMLIPVLRGGTTDINTTLALAICSVVATQVHGIRAVGWGAYIGRFVAIGKYRLLVRQALQRKRLQPALLVRGSLDVFVGLLELFDELTKVLSFAFRLFGNVFGGEVLLMVMAFLMPFLASMPFMAMELFTGAVQAFVFAVLTTAFLGRATTAHAHETSDNVPTRDARGRSANNRTESPASPPSATAAGDALV